MLMEYNLTEAEVVHANKVNKKIWNRQKYTWSNIHVSYYS